MNGGHEQDVWYDWNDMQIQPLTLAGRRRRLFRDGRERKLAARPRVERPR